MRGKGSRYNRIIVRMYDILKKFWRKGDSFNTIPSSQFYDHISLVKVEWWLSWCHEWPELYWARIRHFSDGKADVLFQDETKLFGFDDLDSSRNFVSEDEFSNLEHMDVEDLRDISIPEDTVIETPNWESKQEFAFEYIGKY